MLLKCTKNDRDLVLGGNDDNNNNDDDDDDDYFYYSYYYHFFIIMNVIIRMQMSVNRSSTFNHLIKHLVCVVVT